MPKDKIRDGSPRALSLAATGFGNIIINMAIDHARRFEDHEAALDRILRTARGALEVPGIMNDTPEVVAEAKGLISDILDQVEAHARRHIGAKPARDTTNTN